MGPVVPGWPHFQLRNMSKNRIIRFLSSIRLAIILMAIIAVLCVIATVIPQKLDDSHYTSQFGAIGKSIITFLGFDHVFSSPLFFILGIAFAINLFVCTYGRIEIAVKRTRKSGASVGIWGSPILHLGLCILLVGVALSLVSKHEIYYEILFLDASDTVLVSDIKKHVVFIHFPMVSVLKKVWNVNVVRLISCANEQTILLIRVHYLQEN